MSSLLSNFFHYFDDECIEVITSNRPTFKLEPNSSIPLTKRKIFGEMKFILCRRAFCFVVTKSDRFFGFWQGYWRELTTSFINRESETIIQLVAGYLHVMLLIQNSRTLRTRIVQFLIPGNLGFGRGYTFGEKKKQYKEEMQVLGDLKIENCTPPENCEISWIEILDLDFSEEGLTPEYVKRIACGSYHCVFLTSRGRLLGTGLNDFGVLAQPYVSHFSHFVAKPQLLEQDPSNETTEPFFVKVICGDCSTIALTTEHKVFYCGYHMDDTESNFVDKFTEFKRYESMQKDEYFEDISTTYYGLFLLTSKYYGYTSYNIFGFRKILDKFRVFTLNHPVPVLDLNHCLDNIQELKVFSGSHEFYLILNNSMVYILKDMDEMLKYPSIEPLQLIHTSAKPKYLTSLSFTGCDFSILYWKNYYSSRNSLKYMAERLKRRCTDGQLSDLFIIQGDSTGVIFQQSSNPISIPLVKISDADEIHNIYESTISKISGENDKLLKESPKKRVNSNQVEEDSPNAIINYLLILGFLTLLISYVLFGIH